MKIRQLLGSIALLSVVSSRRLNEGSGRENNSNDEGLHLIVRTRSNAVGDQLRNWSKSVRTFKRIHSVSAVITKENLEELLLDPDVLHIEEDGLVFPDAEDATLYSMHMIQTDNVVPKMNTSMSTSSACSDPDSFKIGVSTFVWLSAKLISR